MSDPKLDAAIKATIGSMGKLIQKPPMTKKLLSKPPFRFLYDTVTEVMKTCSVGEGLYTPEEISSDNVKEKPAKIAFLEKIIHMTAFASGKSLSARPSKIVAGLDPENTNIWLTALAKVAQKQVDTSDAVARVNAGEKPSKSSSARSKDKKERPDGSAKRDKKEKDSKKEKESRNDKDGKSEKESSRARPSSGRPGKAHGERKRPKAPEKSEDAPAENEQADIEASEEPQPPGDTQMSDGEERAAVHQEEDVDRPQIPLERPQSRGGSRIARPGESDEGEESNRRRPERPSSARRGRREAAVVDSAPPSKQDLEQDDMPERPHAPTTRRKKDSAELTPAPEPAKEVAIFGEGEEEDDQDDDDDTFVTVEPQPPQSSSQAMSDEQDDDDGGKDHGALMRKIQEKKNDQSATEISTPSTNSAARKKDQEAIAAEVARLRESIQTLCRTANPLGKIVDYVQEDVDSMKGELSMWLDELQKDSATLADEAATTEKVLRPYKMKLSELDQQIKDQEELIRAVKANTFENEERIHKLLNGIVRVTHSN